MDETAENFLNKYIWDLKYGEIENISCADNSGVFFIDSFDHFNNGFCRLLNINEKSAKIFIELTGDISNSQFKKNFIHLTIEEKIKVLFYASKSFFQSKNKVIPNKSVGLCGHNFDKIISCTETGPIVICSQCHYGWLIASNPENKGVTYEKEYFEGEKEGLGYGNYNQPWRVEKSKRLIVQIQSACKFCGISIPNPVNALDIGSGYGFFRKAMSDNEWIHDGLEISKFAAKTSKVLYGFDSFIMPIEKYSTISKKKYDIITLWDVIEHVKNPEKLLENTRKLLADDGIIALRTPNLISMERDILNENYYSFKKEHLHYFSPISISSLLFKNDFVPLFINTHSHIFSGFFGDSLNIFNTELRGADIFLIAKKRTK